ncbi:hypothetical protein [Mesorhizobium sp. NZP2077]|uniref:hypothetical protein n=1 Tax=Mesorhizobium sp. NZP2077 TaxID=2483404 RepID=UPI0032B26C8D
MREAKITHGDLRIFQKVAALMERNKGRIDGDDLIAAAFLADDSRGRQSLIAHADNQQTL